MGRSPSLSSSRPSMGLVIFKRSSLSSSSLGSLRMHLALVLRPSPHSTHISSPSHLISSQRAGGRAILLRGHSLGMQVATGCLLRLISRSITSLHSYPSSQSISSQRLAIRIGGGGGRRVGSSPVKSAGAVGRGGRVRGGGGSARTHLTRSLLPTRSQMRPGSHSSSLQLVGTGGLVHLAPRSLSSSMQTRFSEHSS